MACINESCEDIVTNYKPMTVDLDIYVNFDRYRGITDEDKILNYGKYPVSYVVPSMILNDAPATIDICVKAEGGISSSVLAYKTFMKDKDNKFILYNWNYVDRHKICTKGYWINLPSYMNAMIIRELITKTGDETTMEVDAPIVFYCIHNVRHNAEGVIMDESNLYDQILYRPVEYDIGNVNQTSMYDHLKIHPKLGHGWNCDEIISQM